MYSVGGASSDTAICFGPRKPRRATSEDPDAQVSAQRVTYSARKVCAGILHDPESVARSHLGACQRPRDRIRRWLRCLNVEGSAPRRRHPLPRTCPSRGDRAPSGTLQGVLSERRIPGGIARTPDARAEASTRLNALWKSSLWFGRPGKATTASATSAIPARSMPRVRAGRGRFTDRDHH